jgi:uncharacterized lipoprotein YddW (UPF0748 family)
MLTTLALLAVVQTAPIPELPREFRAAWVATVANIDWPSRRGLPVAVQQHELRRLVDRAADLNLNALIFQVRPHADAMYRSEIEPWSEYLTGLNGSPPDPMWDPLETLIELAHARGIEVHAWFNPYRAWHPAAQAPADASHVTRTHPGWVHPYGAFYWMDPTEPGVQQRSLDVMLDVVRRYDIDAVHMDDYFYPYPVPGPDGRRLDFPDHRNWEAYLAGGGTMSRGDWRRMHVNNFVRRLAEGIKEVEPWVRFGVSPFGIYRPNVPEGIQAGVDQYDELFADALLWFREGWVDYLSPQLYWRITRTPQSFPVLLNWWAQQNPKGRHLWPGSFTSQLHGADWPVQEILDQITITRGTRGAGGNVHFSFRAFTENFRGIGDALQEGPYAERALAPASPWLDATAPGAPTIEATRDGQGWRVRLGLPEDDDLRFAGLKTLSGGTWRIAAVQSVRNLDFEIPAPRANEPPVQSIAGFVVDRVGNASPMALAPM